VCKQELTMVVACMAAGSELGWSLRSRKRAAGKGSRAAKGKSDAWR
jgi:hypothetical protein